MDILGKTERRTPRVLAEILAFMAAVIGLLTLLGWFLRVPRLTSFGVGLIPMAPSTALLFLLYGAAVYLRAKCPGSRSGIWVSFAAGVIGATIALLIFLLTMLDVQWVGEHLGMDIAGTVGGAPIGHMSVVSAFCFMLASLSFFALLSPTQARSWYTYWALGCAGLLLGTCLVLLLAYFYGAPLFYAGRLIPPAFNTVLAFTLLGFALLLLAWQPLGAQSWQPQNSPVTSHILFLSFGLLATGIVTVGYLYYRQYEKSYRLEVEEQLSAIADLKKGELTQWLFERTGDGSVLHNNGGFISLVRQLIEHHDEHDARRKLQAWLADYQTIYRYDQIRLMDAQGHTCLAIPPSRTEVASVVARRAPDVLATGKVQLQDFYRNEHDGRVYLDILVPIRDMADRGQPLGMLALRIDPEAYLYPFIRRWPTPSETAETLLVRREGREVVFLNELRFATNTVLTLRKPLGNGSLPAAQAALGMEGVMEGKDYRGVPVLAALRTIPNSPWALVARMDLSEVFAPIKERLWQVILMMGVLLFGSGACIGLIWRHQHLKFYRDQAEAADALHQSTLELQDKNVELERFLYTASHDLKSPVVTVRTFLGYLEQDIVAADTERIGKDLKFIRGAADKMGRLLDEILELSRIGRVVSPPVELAFNSLVDEALSAVAGRISERGVTVAVNDPGIMLCGDRNRMAEIWQNLVENAIKFMGDQKDPRIDIGVDSRDAETVFFVRDNGVGIDPRYHTKLFGLFEKLDPKAEGTGIGLALVKRIVELYKGRIWIESPGLGKGACFYFTLPGAVKKTKGSEAV